MQLIFLSVKPYYYMKVWVDYKARVEINVRKLSTKKKKSFFSLSNYLFPLVLQRCVAYQQMELKYHRT